MQLKDYYSILELPPSASFDEIKKAYRRLAHQYHPDKNANDQYASAQFAEIKEAYEVLTNPKRKEYYLQQRWYAQSAGQRKTQEIITPVNILKQLLELDKYVSRLDMHRMDRAGLFEYINAILSNETIEKVNSFSEPDINKGIVLAFLRSSRHLPYNSIKALSDKLMQLKTDEHVKEIILQHVKHFHEVALWDKYKPLIILLSVVLICLLIYFWGR